MNMTFHEECFRLSFKHFFPQEVRKFTDIYQLSWKELQLPLLISVFWVAGEVLHVTEKMTLAFKRVSSVTVHPVVTVRIKLKVCDLHNYN